MSNVATLGVGSMTSLSVKHDWTVGVSTAF